MHTFRGKISHLRRILVNEAVNGFDSADLRHVQHLYDSCEGEMYAPLRHHLGKNTQARSSRSGRGCQHDVHRSAHPKKEIYGEFGFPGYFFPESL